MSNQKNAIRWRKIISDWLASAETQRIFCKKRNLSVSSLRYWRTQLKKQDTNNSELVKIKNPVIHKQQKPIIQIELGYCTMQLESDYAAENLSTVLKAIKEAAIKIYFGYNCI